MSMQVVMCFLKLCRESVAALAESRWKREARYIGGLEQAASTSILQSGRVVAKVTNQKARGNLYAESQIAHIDSSASPYLLIMSPSQRSVLGETGRRECSIQNP